MARSQGRQQLLVHFGMLLATLAFASWWTTHTLLDSARTRRVTNAVLENADVRHYVANTIASVVAPSVGAPALNSATRTANAADAKAAVAQRLNAVLDRRDIRVKLETFVTDAHDVIIGKTTKPAVLDQNTVQTLVGSAMPNLTLRDLAKVHAVTFSVPRYGSLVAGRKALADRFWWYFLGATALVSAAIALSKDRRGTLKLVGAWLIGISVVHLLVLWVVPVALLPRFSHSPWVGLTSAVAGALTGGIVVGLVVLAVAGIVFLLADRFVAPARVSSTMVASEPAAGS